MNKLHIICSKCGTNDMFKYRIEPQSHCDVIVFCRKCKSEYVLNDTIKQTPRKPKYDKSKKVHWVFQNCGCEYKGFYYLTYGRRQCLYHKNPLDYEFINCPCGNKFKEAANGRSKKYCSECRENMDY